MGNFNASKSGSQGKDSTEDIGFIMSLVNGKFDAIWDMLVFDHIKGAHVLSLKICWVCSFWLLKPCSHYTRLF